MAHDKSEHSEHKHSCCGSAGDQATFEQKPVHLNVPEGYTYSVWIVPEMDCPTEKQMIEQKLAGMNGIHEIDCNLMTSTLRIVHQPQHLDAIEQAIKSIGMTLQSTDQGNFATEHKKIITLPLVGSGVMALIAEILHAYEVSMLWVVLAAFISIALCGVQTFKKGYLAIKNRQLNINMLMSVAVTGAILIGQWPEAAMVMFLFTVAEKLEAYSLEKAKNTIRGLMQLAPQMVTVEQLGEWVALPVEQASTGMLARVKPGERIALDGVVVEGGSTVNQAPITGESLPVNKEINDMVFAGTINQAGSFIYKITAKAQDTTLARIIKVVESAQGSRSPTQSFIDRFAKIYIPVVFVLALIIAFVIPLFVGNWFEWIYKSLVLLVIACPCALVISTPVTIVSGLTRAAKLGILIKGGIYLEMGRQLKWLALDKTGTITYGQPKLTDSFLLVEEHVGLNTYFIAASLAARSDHPVSLALAKAAQKSNEILYEVNKFKAIAGYGTEGMINQQAYFLTNLRFISEQGKQYTPEVLQQIKVLEQAGKTIVLLSDTTTVLAYFAVADTIKENVVEDINRLHQNNIKTLILTGDSTVVAQAIAKEAGIDEVYGGQLPEDKLQMIKNKQVHEQKVGMVGDGINDAPALAQADIGFAMGKMGTDTAIETADVTLMDDDLGKISDFVQISHKTHQILIQNISFALGIKILFMLLALTGYSTMWMAVFADVGATLLVVFNGLRLLYLRQ
ncbi:heavy metal translocating P-type ATPase [Neisseria sp. Ec49-e6-T10]|uniref:heavy metal translocating P-type ATPase n=1 Tax=Neisseria sp. Ec49-e6-T10 TaxID=3140744 RepID=UPI003EB7BAE5